ncbi:MAG: DUF1761 domain-containing protein [Candidatus Kapaibacterium sp.]|nr:DUF1761 domain-containing protein [Ignavibacteriota bacterium]MCB9220620.1 DUF1761 domain-containing protein [Ignavibacteria bacterium]
MSTAFASLNWIAVIIAALSTFMIGGAWYSPLMFSKKWMKEAKISEDDLKEGQAKVFGLSFIFSFIAALVLAMFLGPEADILFGLTAGFMIGFAWVLLSMGTTYLFERKSFTLLAINGGYHVVSFMVMGTIIGLFN